LGVAQPRPPSVKPSREQLFSIDEGWLATQELEKL